MEKDEDREVRKSPKIHRRDIAETRRKRRRENVKGIIRGSLREKGLKKGWVILQANIS